MIKKKKWIIIISLAICIVGGSIAVAAGTNRSPVVFNDTILQDKYETAEELDAAIEAYTKRFSAFVKENKSKMSLSQSHELLQQFQQRKDEVICNSNLQEFSRAKVEQMIENRKTDYERYVQEGVYEGQPVLGKLDQTYIKYVDNWYNNETSEVADYQAVRQAGLYVCNTYYSGILDTKTNAEHFNEQEVLALLEEAKQYFIAAYRTARIVIETTDALSDISTISSGDDRVRDMVRSCYEEKVKITEDIVRERLLKTV